MIPDPLPADITVCMIVIGFLELACSTYLVRLTNGTPNDEVWSLHH
jgi:hypothetical protein